MRSERFKTVPQGLRLWPPLSSAVTSGTVSLDNCPQLLKAWQPTPVFLPGESQGQGSLMGCRLWGRTESDTTEATQQQQQQQLKAYNLKVGSLEEKTEKFSWLLLEKSWGCLWACLSFNCGGQGNSLLWSHTGSQTQPRARGGVSSLCACTEKGRGMILPKTQGVL